MVTLETPSLRHAHEFLRAVHRSRPLHRGLVTPPANLAAYRSYLQSLRRDSHVAFFVMHGRAADIVGAINVSEIVRGPFQSAYLGYYAFLPHAGRGLMFQGIAKAIRHCFDELKLHRLEANIQPENTRSIAIVRGLGFRKEGFSPRYLKVCGRWRDHERWAILAEQYRKGRNGMAGE